MINDIALLTDFFIANNVLSLLRNENVHLLNYYLSFSQNIENMHIHDNEFYNRVVIVSRKNFRIPEN